MNIIEGELKGAGLKIGIVISRFNGFITTHLLEGARDCLLRHNVLDSDITVAWVPGAFEIPRVARVMAMSEAFHAVICLGAVIRGETPHFDYVAAEVSKGVATIAMQSKPPVIYGVLTTDTVEQAIDRAGTKAGNKGFDAALAALEMVNLLNRL